MVGLVWIGDGDGNNNATALQREGVSESGGYYVERSLLRYTHGAFSEAVDAVPLPSLPLPPRGRGQVAAAGEPEAVSLGGSGLDGELDSGVADVHATQSSDVGAIQAAFFDGYRVGAGQYSEERIDAMIFCESSWRVNPGGYHLGLAQFDPGTWATVSAITGFADPYNPYHQGFNVAVWASMVSPGTSAGWPSCFHAING